MSNSVFHKPPLYYYRVYKESRSKVNPKVPLKQHYVNERNIRKHIYQLRSQATHLKQKLIFTENDLKHKILAEENKIVSIVNDKTD